ncbi:MAG: formylglycine-generating enzyme family protein [Burkholderiales bacterium]|nr:formylglycine-generating enzyme family protein [Burkholderiales bacterium]
MAVLKWLVITLLSLIAGYYGHKWTASWAGGAASVAAVAIILNALVNGQWLIAATALSVGFYLVFFVIGYGGSRVEGPPPTTKGLGVRSGAEGPQEPLALAGAGTGTATIPKTGLADTAARKSDPAGPDTRSGPGIKDCPECPELVVVPAGQFAMGSAVPKSQGATAALDEPVDVRETPQHRVTVRSFAAGRYAVTRAEFAAFVRATQYQTEAERDGGCFAWTAGKWENNPKLNWREVGFPQADNHPVVCVSWNDAQAYTQWLSTSTRKSYRLLSESEREYAARAGSTFTFWWGENLSADRANYDTTAPGFRGSRKGDWRRATVSVDQFEANPFGLYNVHGNVWEWVQDCQHDTYAGAPVDGSAWTSRCSGTGRVLRGGAWVGDPAGLRSTSRGWFTPGFRFNAGGFRVARAVDLKR